MSKKHCYKLTLCYDGTNYSGWQIQPNANSIQETLQKALSVVTKETSTIIGSGRTDAGVHAYKQVAHFHLPDILDTKKALYSLNGLLPPDIRIIDLKLMEKPFHARFHAKGKIYRYYFNLGHIHSPFEKPYSLHVREPFDLEAVKLGCTHFMGTHNFLSFAHKQDHGSAANSPIKTIYSMELKKVSDNLYVIEVFGSGFLYKMVRNMVGALHRCGKGKLHPEEIPKLLEAKNRKIAPGAAPPHGLFLADVIYE